jgi:Ni,Fe-hydrogenase III large subunit
MLREGLASGGPVAVPERGQVLRGIALELERLANHTGDLGALAGDVGFLPTQAFCGRLRGDWLNLSALLCGNRFGRSMVRPGGVGWDADADRTATMRTRIDAAFADLADSVQLLWDAPSVMGRFEETGRVTEAQAAELGLVGMAARACGLDRDSRREFATGPWAKWPVAVAIWPSGDVYARAMVRWMECERSVAWMRERLDAGLPEGPVASPCAAPRADHVALAVCEGWRGEVLHVAVTDGDGRFLVYKVVDPSFHNWTGLALALRGQQISDFPLCNKSFNLSYCGHDL